MNERRKITKADLLKHVPGLGELLADARRLAIEQSGGTGLVDLMIHQFGRQPSLKQRLRHLVGWNSYHAGTWLGSSAAFDVGLRALAQALSGDADTPGEGGSPSDEPQPLQYFPEDFPAPISEAELQVIWQRSRAARPGPWVSVAEHASQTERMADAAHIIQCPDGGPPVAYITSSEREDGVADAIFIAHSRQDDPRMVQEIARLRAKLQACGQNPDV